jgi:hypothetical protein
MAEKTGNLIKLTYEFNSGWCCEVSFDGERWARVTAREFRSFNGKRRILNVENPNEPYYEEYNGPIYFYGTNRISKTSEKVGMVFVDDKDPRDAKRPRTQAGF